MSDALARGYDVRRPQLSDAEAVHALIVASDLAEFGESTGYSLADLQDDWARTELGQDAWLVVGRGGEIGGYAHLRHQRFVRIDVEIYVHPAHFERGIGTTLVHRVEDRARGLVHQAPAEARVVLQNWINARNADARSLLEREGYNPARYFWRMETELGEQPPEPRWPGGISVRAAAAGESLRPFYETLEEVMADHWGHVGSSFEDWEKQNVGQQFDPGLWFLAMHGGEPAGVALCSVTEGLGWVEQLGVRRTFRRRGLGAALLQHAFREFHARGLPRAGLGVDAASPSGATHLYEKAGMRVTQQYAAYGKELRAGEELAHDVEGAATAR